MAAVTRFYALAEANESLAELEPILLTLAQQRVQLIRLRDSVMAAEGLGALGGPVGPGSEGGYRVGAESPSLPSEELRTARLRMQGLIDQMQAGVARIDEMGIVLRDIETGLVDFPAMSAGRQVWLCWRLGELEIGWWHELESGVAGRRRIVDLA